jgi:hypothetical protein
VSGTPVAETKVALQGTMNIWGRLGISVAIVAAFSIIMTEVLQDKAFYEKYRWMMCGGLIAMGVFLLVVGHFVNRQIRAGRVTEDGEPPPSPFILVNMEYWGLMLAIFGVIVVFIVPFKKVEARAATQPAPAKKAEATNTPPKTNIVAVPPPNTNEVKFPKLRLQGVVVREPRPSALINGRTYFVGELVEGAKVFSVGPTSAVMELQGQYKTLLLDE